jgi:hypothetical protein
MPISSCSLSLLVEALTDHLTPYHHIKLKSAVDKLDEEGKELIKIICDSPIAMFDWTGNTVTTKSTHIRLYLREIGWSRKKINTAFNSVKQMIKEML